MGIKLYSEVFRSSRKTDLPIGPPVLSSASPADAPGNGPVNTATREMKMANPDLRLKLQNKTFITAPGVFDLVSAKLVDRTQAEAIYMSGFAVVASYLGLPDAGIADYSNARPRGCDLRRGEKAGYR